MEFANFQNAKYVGKMKIIMKIECADDDDDGMQAYLKCNLRMGVCEMEIYIIVSISVYNEL